ncbi:MAG: DNA repair protein RecN [Chloroflexota bacterium]
MLQELTIRNFALLEEVRVAFGDGLNVLTGETGAGKSILIDALGAVLGGRVTTEAIRTGTDRAMVEAIFQLPPAGGSAPVPVRLLLDELGLDSALDGDTEDDGALILARELSRSGRSVARVNGRAVPVSMLAQLSASLVDIHGQHEHLSLLRADAQRDLLDRFGGLMAQREAVAAMVKDLRAVRAELRAMQQDEREVARRIDLLSFQVEEIQGAKLQPGEEEALARERTRLANAARLAELAAAVYERLSGSATDAVSAIDQLGQAARDLVQVTRIDAEMAEQEQLLAEAVAQVEEVGRALRAYSEGIEFAPERLEAVNERLDLIHTLQRKYGATIEEVLAFGERAAAELDQIVNREARTAALEQRVAALEQEIAAAATALSSARAAAGDRLAAAVAEELRALSLRGAFEVVLLRQPDPDGVPVDSGRTRCDETGIDEVEFRFAPNVGEPSKPVARTASGGELSRILLALKAVLSAVDRTPTLIFDEVDAGVGGRNGQVLGEKLAGLAAEHQVLCVTHLPQIAAYGDAHFYIAKQERAGRTVTTVTPLDSDGQARELAQMLGGVTPATLEQARQLRALAANGKGCRTSSPAPVSDAARGSAGRARGGRPPRSPRRRTADTEAPVLQGTRP